jgi:hypothetical protein
LGQEGRADIERGVTGGDPVEAEHTQARESAEDGVERERAGQQAQLRVGTDQVAGLGGDRKDSHVPAPGSEALEQHFEAGLRGINTQRVGKEKNELVLGYVT